MLYLKKIGSIVRWHYLSMGGAPDLPKADLSQAYRSLISQKGRLEFAAWMANKIKKNATSLVLVGNNQDLQSANISGSKVKSKNKLKCINTDNHILSVQKDLLSIELKNSHFLILLNKDNSRKAELLTEVLKFELDKLNKNFRDCVTFISTIEISKIESKQKTYDARVIIAESKILRSSVFFSYSSLLSILFMTQGDVFQIGKNYSNLISSPTNSNELKILSSFFNNAFAYVRAKRLVLYKPCQNQYNLSVYAVHSLFSKGSSNDYFAYKPKSNKKYYLELIQDLDNSCRLVFKVIYGKTEKIIYRTEHIKTDLNSAIQVGTFFYSLEVAIHATALQYKFNSL